MGANNWVSLELFRAVVVAQFAEQEHSIPENYGLNPVIGKIYIQHIYCWKDEKRKKRPGIADLKKFR